MIARAAASAARLTACFYTNICWSRHDNMVALVGQKLAEDRKRHGQTINGDGGAGALGDFPSGIELQLLNSQGCLQDTNAMVLYTILFHGEKLVDLSTEEGRSKAGYAQTIGASAHVFWGAGVVLTDLVATNRQLELSRGTQFNSRKGTARAMGREEWNVVEKPLCFLVPEKPEDRSGGGPTCNCHSDHVDGGANLAQRDCSLHSLHLKPTQPNPLLTASSDSSDSDEDEDDDDEA
jgi:hypothetical protein